MNSVIHNSYRWFWIIVDLSLTILVISDVDSSITVSEMVRV